MSVYKQNKSNFYVCIESGDIFSSEKEAAESMMEGQTYSKASPEDIEKFVSYFSNKVEALIKRRGRLGFTGSKFTNSLLIRGLSIEARRLIIDRLISEKKITVIEELTNGVGRPGVIYCHREYI